MPAPLNKYMAQHRYRRSPLGKPTQAAAARRYHSRKQLPGNVKQWVNAIMRSITPRDY